MSEIIPNIVNISAQLNLNCLLDLRYIAKNIQNVEYNPKKMHCLKIKLKSPKCHANIFENGKMVCFGVKSEEELKIAIIKYKNIIKNCGFLPNINLDEIIINNIVACYNIKFPLILSKLYQYLKNMRENGAFIKYNQDVFPAIIYYIILDNSNLNLEIFSSGKIIVTGARKKEHIYNIFNLIYPILLKFRNS